MGLSDDYTVSSSDLTSYEESLEPLQHLSEYAGYFLMVILAIGAVILIVLHILQFGNENMRLEFWRRLE